MGTVDGKEPGHMEWAMRNEWVESIAAKDENTRPQAAPPKANNRRVAFAAHHAEVINHYKNILRCLDPDEFEIVYAPFDADDRLELERFASTNGYKAILAKDALEKGVVYDAIVSVHFGGAGNTPDGGHAISKLGAVQIRLMYSIGKDNWVFSDYNAIYDLILCFGPYHVNNLFAYPNARKVAIGYPRFDHFFSESLDRRAFLTDHGLDPSKPTIAWLPTHGKLSSVGSFSGVVAELAERYNILVKLHPLTPISEPEKTAKLRQNAKLRLFPGNYDNVQLFSMADYVLADYGGSAFGAIYTDKNLVLLDVDGAETDEIDLDSDSSGLLMREWFPHFGDHEADGIEVALGDNRIWERQAETRAVLRDRFFAPFYGFASEMAVAAIRNRDKILSGKRLT